MEPDGQTLVGTEPNGAQQHQPTATMTVAKKLVPTQPQSLLALSGLGLAYGSLRTAMRSFRRATSLPKLRLPRVARLVPLYMRRDYIKYPLLLLVLLATTRRLREAIRH